MAENILSPYYDRGGIPTHEFTTAKQLNFNLGCVVKYIARAGQKPDEPRLTALRKALTFLQFEIAQEERAVRSPLPDPACQTC